MLFYQKLLALRGAFEDVLRILFKSPPFARTPPPPPLGFILIGALASIACHIFFRTSSKDEECREMNNTVALLEFHRLSSRTQSRLTQSKRELKTGVFQGCPSPPRAFDKSTKFDRMGFF